MLKYSYHITGGAFMPTELDTMKHAKEYIDKLANGIDPFTDKPVPDDDIVNNVKLSRCFFYISGILEMAEKYRLLKPSKS